MGNIHAFRKRIIEYLQMGRCTRKDFADTIDYTREHVSKIMNGRITIPINFERRAVRALAQLRCIHERNQARTLLQLMDVPDFLPNEWREKPLSYLQDTTPRDALVVQENIFSLQPTTFATYPNTSSPLLTISTNPYHLEADHQAGIKATLAEACKSNPALTYALVIGIEHYALGDHLSGPADSALQFAQWLISNKVPYENIMLLLSPSPNNQTLFNEWPGPHKGVATREQIHYAIKEWLSTKAGELSYLFWGGYGVMTVDKKRRLFYADTARDYWHHLVLESLRVHFLSDLFKFRHQVLIFDMCANHRNELRDTPFGPGDIFVTGEPTSDKVQELFFASQENQGTTNLPSTQTGLFSRIFQEELGKAALSQWPPDMYQVANSIVMRFRRDEIHQHHSVYSVQYQLSHEVGIQYISPSADQQSYASITEETAYKTHFGELFRCLRIKTPLNRTNFAKEIDVGKNIIRAWERGISLPLEKHLLTVIEVCLHHRTFEEGKEHEEAKNFWIAACTAGATIRPIFDKKWFQRCMRYRDAKTKNKLTSSNDPIPQFISDMTTAITNHQLRTGVEKFLTEYLGKPKHPVPFGGRGAAIDLLDDWLDDPQSPSYLFVASGAGRGKSALLTRWSLHIAQREDVDIILIPVNARFNTNLERTVFLLLAIKLASFYKKDLPNLSQKSMEDWYSLIADYLRRPLPKGHHLVIVIDGIDEAAHWDIGPDLFPHALPVNTRIIISARTTLEHKNAEAWLKKIELEPMVDAVPLNLDPLLPSGIEDILHGSHFVSEGPERMDFLVRELYRLSQGEPLLVKLYIDALFPHDHLPTHLLPETLPSIREGLDGYFEKWWEEQEALWGEKAPLREPLVLALFNTLACAKGPLSYKDLAALLPPGLLPGSMVLKSVLRDMKRLIIGNGQTQGYAFNHPLLGDHFYRQLPDQERNAVESRILQWGWQTHTNLTNGILPPEAVPPYLIQYYGPHLEEARADTRTLSGLINSKWRKAWEAFEGLSSGFLGDVERVWKSAERANLAALSKGEKAPHLDIEVKCAFYRANINNLRDLLNRTLLTEGVRNEVFLVAQGLTYAKQLLEPEQRVLTLIDLFFLVSESQKQELLQDILAMIHWIESESARSEMLIGLGPALSGQYLREALRMAQKLPDPVFRLETISHLIPRIEGSNRTKLINETYQLAQNMYYNVPPENRPGFARGLGRLTLYLEPEHKQDAWDMVLQETTKIKDEMQRTEVLKDLSMVVEMPFFQKMLLVSDQLLDVNLRVCVYAQLARVAPEPLRESVTEKFFQMISKENANREERIVEALIACLPTVQKQEHIELIRQKMDLFSDPKRQIQVLIHLAKYHLISNKEDFAGIVLQKAKSIKTPKDKAKIFGEVLCYFRGMEKYQVEQEAIQIADNIEEQRGHAESLIFIAKHLSQEGKDGVVQRISDILYSFEDQRYQALMLAALASQSRMDIQEKLFKQLKELILMISVVRVRILTLAECVEFFPEALRRSTIKYIFEFIDTILDDQYRLKIFFSLAPFLSKELLFQGFDLAQTVKNNRLQILALARIIYHLPSPDCDIFVEKFKLIQQLKMIGNEKFRINIISLIAHCRDEAIQQEILSMGLTLKNPRYRTQALTTILPFLSLSQQTIVAGEALLSLRSLHEDQREETFIVHHLKKLAPFDESKRLVEEAEATAKSIKSLVEIVLSVSEEKQLPIINRVFESIGEIEVEDCKDIVNTLLPLLFSLSPSLLHKFWSHLLRSRAEHLQQDLLITLSACIPLIRLLGGEEAIEAISAVIQHLRVLRP